MGEKKSHLPEGGTQAEHTSQEGLGSTSCLLCNPDPSRVFYEDDLVLALWEDGSDCAGRALILPRRHISNWFQASPQERHALVEATVALEAMLFASHGSKGYDLGLNSGRVEGTAAFHLHLHVIPRNVACEPRSPLPEARTPPHRRPLVRGGGDPFAPHLLAALEASCGLDIAVAFLLPNGLRRIGGALEAFLGRGGRLRLLTGDYMDVTDPEPPVEGSPLYTFPNVILTPHIAGSMDGECRRMGQYMVDECRRYLAGEPLRWSIDRERAKTLA